MSERVQRLAAKVVVVSEGKALVLKPSDIDPNKDWHLPGGIRDNINEPIEDTALRELDEETGILIGASTLRLLMHGEWPARDKGEPVLITGLFFKAELSEQPDVHLGEEHEEAAWVDELSMSALPMAPESAQAVRLALS